MRKTIIIMLPLFIVGVIMFLGCSEECEPYDDSYLCNPNEPVVLNGLTVPEGRIERGPYACPIEIDISGMHISSPNCIDGIENYSSMLENLSLGSNELDSIDLSPLSSCGRLEVLNFYGNQLSSVDLSPLVDCTNLWWLRLQENQLTTIDLTPLSSCINLEMLSLEDNFLTSIDLAPLAYCTNLKYFNLYNVPMTSIDITPLWDLSLNHLDIDGITWDSASCAIICQYEEEHPNCNIQHDCDCGGK